MKVYFSHDKQGGEDMEKTANSVARRREIAFKLLEQLESENVTFSEATLILHLVQQTLGSLANENLVKL